MGERRDIVNSVKLPQNSAKSPQRRVDCRQGKLGYYKMQSIEMGKMYLQEVK